MFEAQVEMERRSSFLPLVLMMCLLAGIVGLAVYIVVQVHQRTPVNAQQASTVVAATLRSADPAVIHFHTGLVKPTDDETPAAPGYRLLEKAGILKLAKESKGRNSGLPDPGRRWRPGGQELRSLGSPDADQQVRGRLLSWRTDPIEYGSDAQRQGVENRHSLGVVVLRAPHFVG
jgi:hypothetical protein